MKKLFFALIALTVSLITNAQENKQKEVGLAFRNFDEFGFTFKTGSSNSLWRFNTLLISGYHEEENADSRLTTIENIGFGFKMGKEFRKSITENLDFRYGADLSFRYTKSKNETDDKSIDNHYRIHERTTYEPGINIVLGFNYNINENFIVGGELLPSFSYKTGKSKEKNYYSNYDEIESDISGFSYGLSNSSVLLTLAYKF